MINLELVPAKALIKGRGLEVTIPEGMDRVGAAARLVELARDILPPGPGSKNGAVMDMRVEVARAALKFASETCQAMRAQNPQPITGECCPLCEATPGNPCLDQRSGVRLGRVMSGLHPERSSR